MRRFDIDLTHIQGVAHIGDDCLPSPHYRFSRSVVFVNDRRNVNSQILAFPLHRVPYPLARYSRETVRGCLCILWEDTG